MKKNTDHCSKVVVITMPPTKLHTWMEMKQLIQVIYLLPNTNSQVIILNIRKRFVFKLTVVCIFKYNFSISCIANNLS